MNAIVELGKIVDDPVELPFSEDDLASRFSAEHVDDLRYVARWSRWLEWDGCRWREDDTVHVFDLVVPISQRQSMSYLDQNAAIESVQISCGVYPGF